MRTDRGIAVVLLVASVWYGWVAHGFASSTFGDPLGPRAFPLVLSIMLGLCSAILFLRPDKPAIKLPPRHILRIALVLSCLIVYALLVEWIGFLIATSLAIYAIAMIFGGPRWQSLAAAVLFSLSTYALFDVALGLRLPVGSIFG